MKIPFLSFAFMHSPIKGEMSAAFEKVYDSYWYILGKSVTDFEAEYATFSQTRFCVGVSNGLDALYLSLRALGVGEGDEVIVPSNGYIATWLAVTFAGATPVPVEPDVETYNINPALIAGVVTSRTKAIIPIHLYGQAGDMTSILSIAEAHGLHVIEDNAQSHGAAFKGRITGSWGIVNATSFYPGKNLGALGDAGAITTNDEQIAHKIGVLRNYGSAKKYYNDVLGHNMRLDELQGALLSVKLKQLSNWTVQRKELAGWYRDALQGVPGLVLPHVHPDAEHVYHLFVVRHLRRDELQSHLTEKGIGTMIHYPVTPHLQEAYRELGYAKGDFPIAEQLAATSLSIPLWPGMTREMVEWISSEIREFCER
jgi:dTDP-4-amino-4,6-dideoxygalactose transaminase